MLEAMKRKILQYVPVSRGYFDREVSEINKQIKQLIQMCESTKKEAQNFLIEEISQTKSEYIQKYESIQTQLVRKTEISDYKKLNKSIEKRLIEIFKSVEQVDEQQKYMQQKMDEQILDRNKEVEIYTRLKNEIQIQERLIEQEFLGIKNELKKIVENRSCEGERCIKYTNRFERKVLRNGFGKIDEYEDFDNKFNNLITGLNLESVTVVVKILERIRKILDAPDELSLDLYDEQEKKQLEKKQIEFNEKIIQISSNCFAFFDYYLPINQFEDSVIYYKHGIEQLESLSKIKERDIVDVGGFIGDSILIFSPLTYKKVYSFEAVKENCDLIEQTLQLNKIENAVVINKALGESEGNCNVKVAGSASTINDSMGVVGERIEKVEIITLDKYTENNNLDIGLIKVDIEGAEQDFLRGARKTIERDKPTLLISIYHNLDDFLEIKPMIESWHLGYKFKIYRPIIEKVVAETLLIAEVEE